MGDEYPVVPVVKPSFHVTPIQPKTPRIEYREPAKVIPLDTEADESYFRGLEEAVYRLVEGRPLPENTLGRRVLYGVREKHPENAISNAIRIENDIREKKDIHVQGSGDTYTELKKLKDLLDSKVITQEEFDAQKKKILAK